MADLGAWTRALRTGLDADTGHQSIVAPIYLASNYRFDAPDAPGSYEYSRSGNPTRDLLADALTELEGGAGTTMVTTGLAAVTLIVEALVPVGGRVICQHDAYGGTWRLFQHLHDASRLVAEFVDINDEAALQAALDRGPDLVWLETPSNPLLRITDIAKVCAHTKPTGALTLVDNTFCTPLLQQPISLGADLVLHSTTKYINGHSDVVGGSVTAADEAVHLTLRHWANVLGLTSSAFDAYLTLRGLRSLDARLRVHEDNALRLVNSIEGHPALAALHHPSLATHPHHELAARQQSGFGSIVTLDLAGGRDAVDRFLRGLQVFHLAESLGGVESLICHPATMTHAGMSPEAQERAGITAGMLRLSVGVESGADIEAVILEALERASGSPVGSGHA